MMAGREPIRFGLIGVDSSHSVQFTRLFGDGQNGAVDGGSVVAAWRGPTIQDFPPSRDRNEELAEQLAALDVPLRTTPEEVAQECDALLLVASDARTHADYFTRLARFGKPIYVDTRFAMETSDARAMLELAEAENCLVLAGSPKRFTPEFRAALDSAIRAGGRIEEIHLHGVLPTQPGHPGLAWYGVHLVDLAVAALGPGCAEVETQGDRVVLRWRDGRIATLGGPPEWGPLTKGAIGSSIGLSHFEITACEGMLVGLLEAVVESIGTGVPMVPHEEIVATVAIVEAANRALETGLSTML